jgi:hypothetical protein
MKIYFFLSRVTLLAGDGDFVTAFPLVFFGDAFGVATDFFGVGILAVDVAAAALPLVDRALAGLAFVTGEPALAVAPFAAFLPFVVFWAGLTGVTSTVVTFLTGEGALLFSCFLGLAFLAATDLFFVPLVAFTGLTTAGSSTVFGCFGELGPSGAATLVLLRLAAGVAVFFGVAFTVLPLVFFLTGVTGFGEGASLVMIVESSAFRLVALFFLGLTTGVTEVSAAF